MPCANPSCSHPYRSHLGRSGKPFRGGCCEPNCACPGYVKPAPTPRTARPASGPPNRFTAPFLRPVPVSPAGGGKPRGSYRARTSRDKDATTVIGRRLEKIRHHLHLTRPEMAAKIGVSAITYRAWTHTGLGFTWPSMKHQRRLMELEGMVGILRGASTMGDKR